MLRAAVGRLRLRAPRDRQQRLMTSNHLAALLQVPDKAKVAAKQKVRSLARQGQRARAGRAPRHWVALAQPSYRAAGASGNLVVAVLLWSLRRDLGGRCRCTPERLGYCLPRQGLGAGAARRLANGGCCHRLQGRPRSMGLTPRAASAGCAPTAPRASRLHPLPQAAEDKTFGLKNKSKSAKVQK